MTAKRPIPWTGGAALPVSALPNFHRLADLFSVWESDEQNQYGKKVAPSDVKRRKVWSRDAAVLVQSLRRQERSELFDLAGAENHI